MDKASNSVPCIGYKDCSEFDKGESGFCSMEKYYDPDSSNHGLFCYRVGGPVRKLFKEEKMKSKKVHKDDEIIKIYRDNDLDNIVYIETLGGSEELDKVVESLVLSLVKDGNDVEVIRKVRK